MVMELQQGGHEMDRKLEKGKIQLFKGAEPMEGGPSGRNTPPDGKDERSTDNDGGLKSNSCIVLCIFKSECIPLEEGLFLWNIVETIHVGNKHCLPHSSEDDASN